MRQQMQDFLYQTADAGLSSSDSRCKSLSIRQQMQEAHYQTADARHFLSGIGLRDLICS